MPVIKYPTFELTGHILEMEETAQQKTLQVWTRTIVLEVRESDQAGIGNIKLQFSGERMKLLETVEVRDKVTVSFVIKGGTGRYGYFVILEAQNMHSYVQAKRERATAAKNGSTDEKPAPFPKKIGIRDEEPPF